LNKVGFNRPLVRFAAQVRKQSNGSHVLRRAIVYKGDEDETAV
jgi:hypothetical protein